MSKVRVAILGTVGKSVTFDADATVGATLGTNLFDADGNVLTLDELAQLINISIEEADDSGFVPITDHGLLTGLADDDHLQYYTVLGRAGESLVVRDAGGADTVTFAHDGTDLTITGVGTGEIRSDTAVEIQNAAGLTISNAAGTDSVQFSHDGTDVNIATVNTTDINISGQTGAVEITAGAAGDILRVRDSALANVFLVEDDLVTASQNMQGVHFGAGNSAPTASHIYLGSDTFTDTATSRSKVGAGFFPTYTPDSTGSNSVYGVQGNAWFGGTDWGSGSVVAGLWFTPAPTITFADHGSSDLAITGIITGGIINVAGQEINADTVHGISLTAISNIFGGTDNTTANFVRGISISNPVATVGTWGALEGIRIEGQTRGTINRGIYLEGDDAGADIVFGAGADANMYWDGTDLIIDPDFGSEGSGTVLIGTTGDDTLQAGNVIAGDPGVEGSGIQLGGVTYESVLKASDIGGTNAAQVILHRHSTTLAPIIVSARAQGDTSSHTIVNDDDVLFGLIGAGWDGNTDYQQAAQIRIEVDGTPGTADMPGRIVFLTTPSGSGTPIARMSILADGSVNIVDATGADSISFAHDGTDLNTVFVGTTDWNISGASGSYIFDTSIEGNAIASGTTNSFNAISNTPSIWFSETDAAATNQGWKMYAAAQNFYFYTTTDAGASADEIFRVARSGTTATSWQFDTNLVDLSGGGDLRIFDAGDTDFVSFAHDGTDFNIAGTNTALISITGITGFNVVNYAFDVDQTVGAGQDNYVLTYDDGTGLISLEAAGAGTVTGSGANDEVAVWSGASSLDSHSTFTWNGTTMTVPRIQLNSTIPIIEWDDNDAGVDEKLWYAGCFGTDELIFSTRTDAAGAGTEFLVATRTGTTVDTLDFTATNVRTLAGSTFRIYDTGNTDYVQFAHDGTDLNTTFANTTDWNIDANVRITGGSSLRIDDSSGSDNIVLQESGSFAQLFTNPNDLQVRCNSSGGGEVRLITGTVLGIYDAGDTDYATFSHGGLNFTADFTNTSYFDLANLISGLRIRDGGSLVIMDSTDTDSVSIVHDGTNLVVDTTSTDNINFTSNAGTIFFQMKTDDVTTRVAVTNGWDFEVRGGSDLVIRDSSNLDWGLMRHNGTNFISSFQNTADWNIVSLTGSINMQDGVNLRIWDAGDTDYVQMSHNGTDFTHAFTNTAWLRFTSLTNGVLFQDGAEIRIYHTDDVSYMRFAATATQGLITLGTATVLDIFANGGSIRMEDDLFVRTGHTFRLYDSTETDNVAFTHDGTDLNIVGISTTDINFTGMTALDVTANIDIRTGHTLVLFDSTNGDTMSLFHDGTDANFAMTGTTDLNITGCDVAIGGDIGFYGTAPATKPTVTGSRGGNAALASLLTALAGQGLITDSSTA